VPGLTARLDSVSRDAVVEFVAVLLSLSVVCGIAVDCLPPRCRRRLFAVSLSAVCRIGVAVGRLSHRRTDRALVPPEAAWASVPARKSV